MTNVLAIQKSTLHRSQSFHSIRNIDKGNFSWSIFLDLAKAFDEIDYKIILTKHNYYVIREVANDWIRSYLIDCKQFVCYIKVINQAHSISSMEFCKVLYKVTTFYHLSTISKMPLFKVSPLSLLVTRQ